MSFKVLKSGLYEEFQWESKKISERYVEVVAASKDLTKLRVVIHSNKKLKWNTSEVYEVRAKWILTDLDTQYNRSALFKSNQQFTYSKFMKWQLLNLDKVPTYAENQYEEVVESLPPPRPSRSGAPRCKKSRKVCFDSEGHAKRKMRRKSARLRAYKCPHCNKWHMSNPDKTWRKWRSD